MPPFTVDFSPVPPGFTPAMRRRIGMVKLYRRALHAMPDTIDGQPPLPVAQDRPVTLDELVAERPQLRRTGALDRGGRCARAHG